MNVRPSPCLILLCMIGVPGGGGGGSKMVYYNYFHDEGRESKHNREQIQENQNAIYRGPFASSHNRGVHLARTFRQKPSRKC